MTSSIKISTGKFTGPDKIAAFRTFKTGVESLAEARQTRFDPLGLLGFVISEAEWNLLPENVIAADPAANPPVVAGFRPLPTIPDQPEMPAAAAAAGHFARFKYLTDVRDGVTDDLFALKQAIMDALDEGDMATITHPLRGTRDITHAGIMAALQSIYGKVQPADAIRWKASLADNVEPGTTLAQRMAQHKRTVLLLADIADVNQFEQLSLFKTAMATHVDVAACIERYEHANPNVFMRTFADLETFLSIHDPPLSTMSSLGYSNATTPAPDQDTDGMALAANNKPRELIPRADTRYGSGRGGRGGRGGAERGRSDRTGRYPGRGQSARTPMYCYAHGYRGHSGPDCDHMAANLARDGGPYSPKNVAATSHLDDTSGSWYNAPN